MNWTTPEATSATNETTVLPLDYRVGLVFLYMVVFVGGVVGLGLMCTILRSNMLSITTVSVINLMVVHSLFLLTVPFRIYYYVSAHWVLGRDFCKLVSGMIHAHMYLAFIFYIVILTARFLTYFEWGYRLEFYRALHAVIASVTVWAIILGSALPATVVTYGSGMGDRGDTVCFDFGGALQNTGVQVLNYIICAVVLLVWTALASCQLYTLWRVRRKHGAASFAHQEFWAQIKSFCFVLVMFFSLVPYHAFRIYYVSSYQDELERVNEVFLAFTALSCYDMLMFAGRDVWRPIYTKCCISIGKR